MPYKLINWTFKSLKNSSKLCKDFKWSRNVQRVWQNTFSAFFLMSSFPGLSLISVFILLAVFIDAPLNTSTMILSPPDRHFCILSSHPTQATEWQPSGAYLMVIVESFASLLSIQGQLTSSSVTFLSSLLIFLTSIVFTLTSVFFA